MVRHRFCIFLVNVVVPVSIEIEIYVFSEPLPPLINTINN